MKLKPQLLLACFTIIILLGSCSELFEGDVTGVYVSTTESQDVEIRISHGNAETGGYDFSCIVEEFGDESPATYRWSGTFQNVPVDMVLNSQLQDIGAVEFAEGMVVFKAKTLKPGEYKAYTDDMADILGRSRTLPADSAAVTDSLKAKK